MAEVIPLVDVMFDSTADHSIFQRQGFPAVTLYRGNQIIHTPMDRLEFVDIDEIRIIGRRLAGFILDSGSEMFGR